ncbi:glycosyltransferase [Desulfitobacterium metallireducens]|uniref:glycosyltransferase n=1 Tax=Desulfitobacterium metallireducens TaxID=142877 RepID=UPI00023149B3|nr:glycosyltransferase [Desulfitobacterium metallireducens]
MRLCFLGDAGSIHLQRWINYFVQAGYEVEVISFRPCEIKGTKVHLLAHGRSGRLAYIEALAKIRGLLREIQPDLLHAHYATSFGLLALLSGFKPLVVSAWGSDVLVAPKESVFLRMIVEQVLRHADALTSDSAYMSERMRELLKGQEQVLKTVTMGVSKAWFEEIPEGEKKEFQILSLRGHQEIYNIDIIIEAMAQVIQKIPQAKLVVAGEGPETSALKTLTSSLGLEKSIDFVGQLPHAAVQTYLNESSISVSVPSSDATAVSLLETMACGSFPVVSDLPANREWIDPEVNGLLVPAKDAPALAQSLVRALEEKELREKAQTINKQRVKDKAIWEDNMREMEELYRDLTR